ncbi:DUF1254 domain-containing protein [Kribbella sp. NPDC049584]|uniref:DUF1254 domain-containing protein n=1 Tax=Kribbella sp. NPDC049584 TaxID=3154833 RepID=UPI00341518A5
MEVTRRVSTNTEKPEGTQAPMNSFAHLPAFPDASFTNVVRPNADTLYSSLWLDVRSEPLVLHVPDSHGRYYLLQMLDMWTDVFAAPGARTTGTGEQTYAVVGPGWHGQLSDGLEEIRCPTGMAWMIGRTQTNGPTDYDNVHTFQAGLTATPLSRWGAEAEPPAGRFDPNQDMSAPTDQVSAMRPAEFFGTAATVMGDNPPHPTDTSMLQRARWLGFQPGAPFDLTEAPEPVREAVDAAPAEAFAQMQASIPRSGALVNNWQMVSSPIGTYGTDYLKRALIAFIGLAANPVEDAIYPTAMTDADGQPFDSSKRYVLHFPPGQLPPTNAFWSLSMYDQRQLFTANPINRFAIGDRDALATNADGSLDIHISRETPGADLESNWLPAPSAGPFTMNLRLYWPRPEALDGRWTPPPIHPQS